MAIALIPVRRIIDGTRKHLCHHRALKLTSFILCALLAYHVVTMYNLYYVLDMGRACTVSEYNDAKDETCICYANRSGELFTRADLPKYADQLRCAFTVRPRGRLGNLMGEYATLYALAKMNNRPAFLDPAMASTLSTYFKITLPVLPRNLYAAMGDNWENYLLDDWMEERHRNINGTFVMLDGFPCSWTFYHHIRDEILREFTFHSEIRDHTDMYLWNVRGLRRSATFVGVHVRRGDYVGMMAGHYKGVVADKLFFQDAMAYFRTKYHDAVFVVASDDMEWCKKNIDNTKGDVHFAGTGDANDPIRDFAILASCNHSIITIGTYGYWTAYLAGGETVHLVNYTAPDSVFLEFLKYDKAYLPNWIAIPANFSKANNVSICKLNYLIALIYFIFFVVMDICSVFLKH